MKRLLLVLVGAIAFLPAAARSTPTRTGDWPVFGYDAARHNSAPSSTINARNVGKLKRLQVTLDGTVDSSPISVGGKFIVTTTYGRTEAIDPNTGKVLWRFTPPSYAQVAGSAQITNASPAASTDRTAVFAAASDGRIRKLRLSDGKVVWSTAITRDPTHEKIGTTLNLSGRFVIATTGGYTGDAPPYQGHVALIDRDTGSLVRVFNSLCSNRGGLLIPATCTESGSAIWGRGGAVLPSQRNWLTAVN